MPYVYTLPMDVSLEQTPELKPCADIPFLDARLKHDISSLTGVPSELLISRGMSNESSVRTRTSTHQFHANMDCIAQSIQRLLADVYTRAYHNSATPTVSFMSDAPSHNKQTNAKTTASHDTSKRPHTHSKDAPSPAISTQCGTRKQTGIPDIQWFVEVAPMLELDTVDDLVQLASIEGALSSVELRRVVQMLLYGKGTPAGSSSNMCSLQTNTDPIASVSITDTGASSKKSNVDADSTPTKPEAGSK